MRAYKIQDVKREVRIGVTAKSFDELVEKGCQKLKVSLLGCLNEPINLNFSREVIGLKVDSGGSFDCCILHSSLRDLLHFAFFVPILNCLY